MHGFESGDSVQKRVAPNGEMNVGSTGLNQKEVRLHSVSIVVCVMPCVCIPNADDRIEKHKVVLATHTTAKQSDPHGKFLCVIYHGHVSKSSAKLFTGPSGGNKEQ